MDVELNYEPLAIYIAKKLMGEIMSDESEDYIEVDRSRPQNKVIEEKNSDDELKEEFDRNAEDDEE